MFIPCQLCVSADLSNVENSFVCICSAYPKFAFGDQKSIAVEIHLNLNCSHILCNSLTMFDSLGKQTP